MVIASPKILSQKKSLINNKKQIMYNQEPATKMGNSIPVEKRPDFLELIDALNREILSAGESTNIIFHNINQIKNISEPSPMKEEKDREPSGVIEHLWVKIKQLQGINETLRQSARGIQSIVGG